MVAKGTAAEEPAGERATGRQAADKAAKRTAAGKTAAKGAAAKKTPAGKQARKPTPGADEGKGTAGKAAAKKPAAKKTAAGKAKKAAATRTAAETGQTGAHEVAARRTTTETAGGTAVPPARAAAGELAVRAGEEPWTEAEVTEARDELLREARTLREEITAVEDGLTGLMRDSGDGAGDDQADAGTKNVTREHEMALARYARETLYQTERALERLEAGTYGLCENCGNAIGKARMQAFPRATLCVDCKQRQERRG